MGSDKRREKIRFYFGVSLGVSFCTIGYGIYGLLYGLTKADQVSLILMVLLSIIVFFLYTRAKNKMEKRRVTSVKDIDSFAESINKMKKSIAKRKQKRRPNTSIYNSLSSKSRVIVNGVDVTDQCTDADGNVFVDGTIGNIDIDKELERAMADLTDKMDVKDLLESLPRKKRKKSIEDRVNDLTATFDNARFDESRFEKLNEGLIKDNDYGVITVEGPISNILKKERKRALGVQETLKRDFGYSYGEDYSFLERLILKLWKLFERIPSAKSEDDLTTTEDDLLREPEKPSKAAKQKLSDNPLLDD